MPDLLDALRARALGDAMFAPGQAVVVAVSGGPDSTALLHALARLRDEWGLRLVAAHLNHQFRGEEAERDSAYVAALAASLGVEARIGRVDVPGMRRRRRLSAQEAARSARHAWLERTAAEVGATRIALGHTRDDRVETILINLIRGTGTEGLRGFPAVDWPRVRPLYDVKREDTLAYCDIHGLAPRFDASNMSLDYQRNRIRTELLPLMRSYYNSRVDEALLRMSDIVAADDLALDAIAQADLSRYDRSAIQNEVILECDVLNSLMPAHRRRITRSAVLRVRGQLQGLTFDMVEQALAATLSHRAWSVTLPDAGTETVRLVCTGEHLCVSRTMPPSSPVPWSVALDIPGATSLPRGGLITVTLYKTRAELQPQLSFEREEYDSPDLLILPWSEAMRPLTARSWRAGDRIQRAGGTRKLQDLFVDAHIPAMSRSHVPVVTDGSGRVLMVAGLALTAESLPLNGEIHPANGPEGSGWLTLRYAR